MDRHGLHLSTLVAPVSVLVKAFCGAPMMPADAFAGSMVLSPRSTSFNVIELDPADELALLIDGTFRSEWAEVPTVYGGELREARLASRL